MRIRTREIIITNHVSWCHDDMRLSKFPQQPLLGISSMSWKYIHRADESRLCESECKNSNVKSQSRFIGVGDEPIASIVAFKHRGGPSWKIREGRRSKGVSSQSPDGAHCWQSRQNVSARTGVGQARETLSHHRPRLTFASVGGKP